MDPSIIENNKKKNKDIPVEDEKVKSNEVPEKETNKRSEKWRTELMMLFS